MDNFVDNIDSFTQTKDETNFPRWLSTQLLAIKNAFGVRRKLLYCFAGASNNIGATPLNIVDQTIPAGNHVKQGGAIKGFFSGSAANNTNAKTISIAVNGTVLFNYSIPVSSTIWSIELVWTCDPSNLVWRFWFRGSNASAFSAGRGSLFAGSLTALQGASLEIITTMTGVANGDITYLNGTLEYLGALS